MKKIIMSSVSFVLIISMLMGFECAVGEKLTPITYATYFNHDMKLVEKDDQSADILFIGASRVFRSFIPSIFEDELGVDFVVNAGTASQPVCGTYYLLKDMIERLHPKQVVFGVSRKGLTDEADLQAMLTMSDRLSPLTRLQFAATCIDYNDWLYLLDTYRYRNSLEGEEYKKLETQKSKMIANNYDASWKSTKNYYYDFGYIYSSKGYEFGNVKIEGNKGFEGDEIRPENVRYIEKIIELCEKNNIRLTLVTPPMTTMRIYNVGNYQMADDYFRELADEHGLDYVNLNYLKDKDTLIPDMSFLDMTHTNYEGAVTTSKCFAEIYGKMLNGEDVSDYFYSDLDEFKQSVNRIVAVKAKISDKDKDGVADVELTSLKNDDVTPLYCIQIALKEGDDYGEYQVLSDWSPETELNVNVPVDQAYKIKVRAWSGVNGEGEAYQEYKFK